MDINPYKLLRQFFVVNRLSPWLFLTQCYVHYLRSGIKDFS